MPTCNIFAQTRIGIHVLLTAALCLVAASLGQARPQSKPLTNDDIVKMVHAKLNDAVIEDKIKSSTCEFDTSTDALITLKGEGVSNAVLQAMQQCGAGAESASAVARSTAAPSAVKVFLAGTGKAEFLPDVLDGLDSCLQAKDVTGKELSSGPESRGNALEEMKKEGGSYLLFASLNFAPGVNIRSSLSVESLDGSGKELWKEKANGSMFITSESGYVHKMVKNACHKLDAHVGKEGLPKDGPK